MDKDTSCLFEAYREQVVLKKKPLTFSDLWEGMPYEDLLDIISESYNLTID
jgi:hypothetical protein